MQHDQRMDRPRLTHLIVKYQKTFRLLMGDEQVTRSETLQATSWWWDDDDYDDDDDDDDDEQFFL